MRAEASDVVPVEKWGRDHWSTLAYLETICVDKQGVIGPMQMRTDARLHSRMSMLQATEWRGHLSSSDKGYPTRLKDDEMLHNHDDWSCIEDMIEAGFVILIEHPHDTSCIACDPLEQVCHRCVALTEKGRKVANALRQNKADGKSYATFVWEE